MRPKRSTRHGEAADTEALGQLDDALDKQRDLAARAEAAEGTSGEQQAADELGTARHQAASREAWVVWTERGL